MEVFLDKHQGKIIILAVLLAIAAVVLVVVKGLDEAKEKEAGAMLSSAEDVSGLQKVVGDYEALKLQEAPRCCWLKSSGRLVRRMRRSRL